MRLDHLVPYDLDKMSHEELEKKIGDMEVKFIV